MGSDGRAWTALFPVTRRAPGSARHWVDGHTEVSAEARQRIVLLVSELVSNSVRHSGLGGTARLAVSLRHVPAGWHVEVVDEGVGLERAAIPMAGHGLGIVAALSDAWGHRNDPTRVWFDVRDPDPPDPAH